MLTLAPEQLRELDERFVQRYLLRLDAFLLQEFPERLRRIPEEERLRHWKEALNRAMDIGVKSERHVCLYAILILLIGFPRLSELLAEHGKEGEIDMDLVYQHACASGLRWS